jgi:hypothetical protein
MCPNFLLAFLKARGTAIAECNVSPRTVARRSPEMVSVIPGVGAPGAWVTVRGAGFTGEPKVMFGSLAGRPYGWCHPGRSGSVFLPTGRRQ